MKVNPCSRYLFVLCCYLLLLFGPALISIDSISAHTSSISLPEVLGSIVAPGNAIDSTPLMILTGSSTGPDLSTTASVSYGAGNASKENATPDAAIPFAHGLTRTTLQMGLSGRYIRVQLAGTNVLSLAEVEVIGGLSQTNLAVGQLASQSSEYFGASAGRAIDGNTSGNSMDNSITHSAYENQPWWQVDLGSVQQLTSIVLWNRTDCCSERLSDVHVFISDFPFSSANPTVTAAQTGVTSYFLPGLLGTTTSIHTGFWARYVRVQLAGTNVLSLAEVEVIGGDSQTSLAVGKLAAQSSDAWDGVASRAVDGNTNGNYFDNSVTHTNYEFQPWWQVDLGTQQPITSIVLWNRTDCCSDRLSDVNVLVSNVPFTSTDLTATQNQPGVLNYYLATVASSPETVVFAAQSGSQYIEAEAGTITTPMSLQNNATASGGTYISTPTANAGSATYTVTVPSGTHYLWGRVLAPDSNRDSFFVSIDGKPEEIYDTAEGTWSSSWQWSQIRKRINNVPAQQRITFSGAGTHVITVRGREVNSVLDRLFITKGSNAVPKDPPAPPSDTTSPVISGVLASNVTAGGATINWTTNENSDTQVQYGPTTSYGSVSPLNGTPTTSHTTVLSGLAAGTQYNFRVLSRDAAGNLATSGNFAFTTLAVPDTTAPAISAVSGSGISSSGATIIWTTNEASDTQVEYGPTTNYGSNTVLDPSMVTSHAAALVGLSASSLYHYRVKSRDIAGNLATSVDFTFNTAAPPVTGGAQFYVSVTGTSGGNGSISSPWNLQTALNHPSSVRPGDTIWLRGGTYSGDFSSNLLGTSSGGRIVVSSYPGEWAVLDGGLSIYKNYVQFMALEIKNSAVTRRSSQATTFPDDILRRGVYIYASYVKLINLIIHDLTDGITDNYAGATGNEVYGCLVYYCGWDAPDRGHGHGIYPQNNGTVVKVYRDNIIHNQFSHGLHIYGSSASTLKGFVVEGNVSFHNGSIDNSPARNFLVGGGSLVEALTFSNNYGFYKPSIGDGQTCNLGWDPYGAGLLNPVIQNNVLVSGDIGLHLFKAVGATFTGNTIWGGLSGFVASLFPSNTFIPVSGRPSGVQVFVRPNQYDTKRAHIVVFNWALSSSVAVDVSSVLGVGDQYELRSAQNYFGPLVASGTYNGTSLPIPMNALSTAVPINWSIIPPSTAPDFGAFVLIRR